MLRLNLFQPFYNYAVAVFDGSRSIKNPHSNVIVQTGSKLCAVIACTQYSNVNSCGERFANSFYLFRTLFQIFSYNFITSLSSLQNKLRSFARIRTLHLRGNSTYHSFTGRKHPQHYANHRKRCSSSAQRCRIQIWWKQIRRVSWMIFLLQWSNRLLLTSFFVSVATAASSNRWQWIYKDQNLIFIHSVFWPETTLVMGCSLHRLIELLQRFKWLWLVLLSVWSVWNLWRDR